MADPVVPDFNITREQIAAFVKDPRTVRDIEAFLRMVREQLPGLISVKVDETRLVDSGAGLTGGGTLETDLTLAVGAGTGIVVNADDVAIDTVAEAERIRDVIGTALTDSATIDFTADDALDTITAALKNTAVAAGAYGDATHVATFTVDAQGRLTLAASVAITFPSVGAGGGLLASNNLSDVVSAGTSRTNLGLAIGTNVQAFSAVLANVASSTYDAALKPLEHIQIACSDETTAITTGTAKVTFRMPYAFTVTDVRASVNTAPTGSTILIDINEGGTTIISTKLMIDTSEKTSTTAATPAVISDASLADDAEMTIDFDQVGSTIAGKGVKVILIGHRT